MAAIVWTDAPAVDGTTLWTAAREAQLRADILAQVNGNLQTANMAAGGLGTAALANPFGFFCIPIVAAMYADALEAIVATPVTSAEYGTTRVGVTDRITATIDIPIGLPYEAVFLDIATACYLNTGTSNARFRRNGADVANTTVSFTAATLVRPATAPAETTCAPTDTLLIRLTISGGANDGVVLPIIYTYWKMRHRA